MMIVKKLQSLNSNHTISKTASSILSSIILVLYQLWFQYYSVCRVQSHISVPTSWEWVIYFRIYSISIFFKPVKMSSNNDKAPIDSYRESHQRMKTGCHFRKRTVMNLLTHNLSSSAAWWMVPVAWSKFLWKRKIVQWKDYSYRTKKGFFSSC